MSGRVWRRPSGIMPGDSPSMTAWARQVAMNRTILLRHLSNSSLAGQSREFSQERIRLGRKADNDVVFNPDQDRLVSGHHCEILAQGDQLFVLDPGSTNGTYGNGQRVQGRQ